MKTIFQEFQKPGIDSRGMFRCWFPDAGADLDRVSHQVRSVYEAGFSGMEIAMVPQYAEFDQREYGWATPRWKEMLRTILRTADSLPEAFKIDLTITAHWPPALNTIDPNHPAAQKELRHTVTKITSGGTLELPLPETRVCDDDGDDAAHFIFTDTFLCAITGTIVGRKDDKYILAQDSLRDVSEFVTVLDKTTPAGIALDENRFGSKPKLADTQHYYAIDLDAAGIPACSESDWQEGDTLLFAYFTRGTGQTLSGRSMPEVHMHLPMADKMYAADYYSAEGTDAIIDVWESQILNDPEIRTLLNKNGGAIFEDSIELACATIPWTNRFAKEFRRFRGYDILPFLPVLQSLKGSPVRFLVDSRIEKLLVDDYYTTLNDLYLRDHVERLKTWTRTFGYQYRAQSYGGDVNTAAASCVLDIAEGESLGFGEMREFFRNISGGVHMTGRKFFSDEILADLMKGYALDWKCATATFNSNWAAGVNRVVIHGMSFEREVSDKYNQWPGWHAFQDTFADPWGERQPYWEHIRSLSDMIARTQAVLQSGKPKIDLAIYKGQRAYGCGYTRLLDFGYSYDVISNPHLFLPQCVVQYGSLCPDGPAYRALLIVDQEMLPSSAAEKLKALAADGLPIIFVGRLPVQATGAFTPNSNVTDAVKTMLSMPGVFYVRDLDEAVATLKTLSITARASYRDVKLESICRADESGTYYFLFNNDTDDVSANITLKGSGRPVILNAWTGAITPIPFTQVEEGVMINVSLASKDAMILALLPDAQTPQVREDLPSITLRALDTTVESWGPDEDAAVPTQAKRTTVSFGAQPVGPWDALPATKEQLAELGVDGMHHVSGRGFYRTAFSLPACDGAVLTVSTGECMVVGGSINGKNLPAINQRSGQVDLTGLVHEGDNQLELVLATTLINRLRISHPLFDGNGDIPAPPSGHDANSDDTIGNEDYELPGAPAVIPTPTFGPFTYGLYSAVITPYVALKNLK